MKKRDNIGDVFSSPDIFGNKNLDILNDLSNQVNTSGENIRRVDKIANEMYGNTSYYQAIIYLNANNPNLINPVKILGDAPILRGELLPTLIGE